MIVVTRKILLCHLGFLEALKSKSVFRVNAQDEKKISACDGEREAVLDKPSPSLTKTFLQDIHLMELRFLTNAIICPILKV